VKAGELLLRYERLEERGQALDDELGILRDRLARDPEVERVRAAHEEARAAHEHARHRLESMDREMNVHLSRMRAHERELMSGRVRNPGDLTRMSTEVEHMKAALAEEEDRELEVMAEVERTESEVARAEAALSAAVRRSEETRPRLESRIAAIEREIEGLKAEQAGIWEEVPVDYRSEYRRLAPRVHPPVAEASGGVCQACHVALTPSELQQVKRGDHLLTCQSCSRILVAV
jgi:predicted  nucleic acid-binding Zn-ribbon protein